MQREILREREVEDETAQVPILWNVRFAGIEGLSHALGHHVGAGDLDAALGRAPKAGDRVDQLALAVAVHARERDDLSRAHVEGDVADGVEAALVAHAQVGDLEQRLPGSDGFFSTRSSTSRPTIIR